MAESGEKTKDFNEHLKSWQRRIRELEGELERHPGVPRKSQRPAAPKPPTRKAEPSGRAGKSGEDSAEIPKLSSKVDRVESNLQKLQSSIEAISKDLDDHHREPAPEVPRAKVVSWKAWVAAGAAVCGLCWGLWVYRHAGAEYALPSSHISSLVWQGNTLWVADRFEESIYRTKLKGREFGIVQSHLLKDSHVMGLAVVGDRIYVADSWEHAIQRRLLDDDLTLEVSWSSPGKSPSALFFDGRHLWSADKDESRVYQHALDDDLSVVRSFTVGHEPIGLYADEKYLWSSSGDGLFYRHDIRTGQVSGVYHLPEPAAEGASFSSFTWKGRRLWVAREGSTLVIERPWWRLRKGTP